MKNMLVASMIIDLGGGLSSNATAGGKQMHNDVVGVLWCY